MGGTVSEAVAAADGMRGGAAGGGGVKSAARLQRGGTVGRRVESEIGGGGGGDGGGGGCGGGGGIGGGGDDAGTGAGVEGGRSGEARAGPRVSGGGGSGGGGGDGGGGVSGVGVGRGREEGVMLWAVVRGRPQPAISAHARWGRSRYTCGEGGWCARCCRRAHVVGCRRKGLQSDGTCGPARAQRGAKAGVPARGSRGSAHVLSPFEPRVN